MSTVSLDGYVSTLSIAIRINRNRKDYWTLTVTTKVIIVVRETIKISVPCTKSIVEGEPIEIVAIT